MSGCISVDRSKKDEAAKTKAIEILEKDYGTGENQTGTKEPQP